VTNPTEAELRFSTFEEFYPFYLSQHQHPICRKLHVLGTLVSVAAILYCLIVRTYAWIPPALLLPYPFGWFGHFVFEKNRPASFRWPLYSMRGDLRMTWQYLLGQLPDAASR
jgi:hypothetical protein